VTEPNGKRRRIYREWATPFELLKQVPGGESYLRVGVTLAGLKQTAQEKSDTEAALAMQQAKRRLLTRINKLSA